MIRTVLILLAGIMVAVGNVALGQELEPGPQVLTFFSTVDDTDQPYAVYLPPNYDASREYPLVMSLHGAGSNHRLNLRRVFGKSNAEGENDVEASRYFPEWEDVDYIVASPYARGTMGYQSVAEKDVLDVLADVKRRFSVDEDRTYLTGLSMGGGGTLWIGLTRPDLWAAVAPVCPAPPPETAELAPNALHIPVHVFQGAADPVVRPESVRDWVERLRELGTQVEYTEYPGVGHDSWVNAYADGQIFDWFDQFERPAHPERVRFVSDRYAYDEAYWVRLDALTPGTPARVDARLAGPNRLEVETEALDGFTLRLAGHPRYAAGEPVDVVIDGERLQVAGADSLSFRRSGSTWQAGRYLRPPGAKRPGLEGPMSEAVASRHVYVYGTADDPSDDVAALRHARALKAAEWAVYRGPFWGRVMVFPRVVADRDVRESDFETANLVLFGTQETNSIIARYADRLPVHLEEADGDYGLAYAVPVDGRYVLVSSGRPWWRAGAATEQGMPFAQQIPALRLRSLQDYVLFEGSVDTVVAAGRFDRGWRLPAADAEAMEATGAVTVAAGARVQR